MTCGLDEENDGMCVHDAELPYKYYHMCHPCFAVISSDVRIFSPKRFFLLLVVVTKKKCCSSMVYYDGVIIILMSNDDVVNKYRRRFLIQPSPLLS